MAGCPEGRVAVQNECWLLSSPDAPSCGEACGGDAFVDVAGTQARGSQTEVVGCLEHGFLDGRHIRAQHLHLIPQQMNELNRPWCARCVGGVSAALSFGVCCLNGGEERDEGALHML